MAVLEYHLYSNQNSWINNIPGFYYGLRITSTMTLWVVLPSPLLDLHRHSNPLAPWEFVLSWWSSKVTPFTWSSPPLTISLTHAFLPLLPFSPSSSHTGQTPKYLLYLDSCKSAAWNLIALTLNHNFQGKKWAFILPTKKKYLAINI